MSKQKNKRKERRRQEKKRKQGKNRVSPPYEDPLNTIMHEMLIDECDEIDEEMETVSFDFKPLSAKTIIPLPKITPVKK